MNLSVFKGSSTWYINILEMCGVMDKTLFFYLWNANSCGECY